MPTTDVHTHFLPEAMITELRAGRSWHGWRRIRLADGREAIESAAGIAPFSLEMADEPWSERIRRRRMDAAIDRQAIMLPAFLWNYHDRGPEGAAFCRDVNDEAADLARNHEGSIVPMGVLPLQDRALAIEEVARSVRDLGIRTFAVGTHVEGKNLDDPNIAPVLDAVCEADASLMLHASYFGRAGESRMTDHDFGNSIGVPLEDGLAMMSIVYSGLLDRHPEARVGSCHGGGWVAFGIGRLWLRYTQGRDGGHLDSPPADYLRRMYYDCLLHDDLSLETLVRRVGASQVMVGTDHPYKGDMPGGSVAWIRQLGFLSEDDKIAILETNAATFLGTET